jgi:ABC-2 type transport system ATP-binding protein
MQKIIKVEQLSKVYGSVNAVNSLSFTLEKGKVLGLLGANGAGKSTSIECILGTKKKDSGKVTILGMNPTKDRKRLFQKVGVQFQEANYQREIRVDELCMETAAIYKNASDWRELLQRFGLKEKEKNEVKDLSGGERQRLFIVLALIPKPEIVFLDELTTGLDARARRDVWRIMKKLKDEGLTIILTSHFMDEIEILCDEIIILKKGTTVFQGTVEQAIKSSPFDKFEDAYLYYSDNEKEEFFDEDI